VGSPRAVAAVVAGLVVSLSACSADAAGSAAAPSASTPPASAPVAAAAPTGPFGAGCASLLPAGDHSLAAMAGAPAVQAAARNRLLTAFADAARAASLADSLDAQQDVTVLVFSNAAFEAIPAGNRQALLADTPRLTAVLTHHVIQGRVGPDRLAGTHTTLNNDEITVEGSGDTFTIAAPATAMKQQPATVMCGNVPTANAIVYVIDQVLAPPA
jgi:uncharacterized surface protein with fasciclin (FAS1) repeats